MHAELDLDIVGRLQDMAGRHHTTLFVVMLSVFSTLLHHLTGQRDLATATLFANRIRPEVMNTVGFLANLVVLRTRLEGATTFGKVIERVRGTVLDGMSHQELPYHLVSHGTYASGGPRLDEVVFQMIGERIDETLCAGDLRIQGVVPEVEGRFDFELALIVRANGVGAKLDYREDRVDPPWADRFLSAYVAAAACAEPDAPLDALLDQRPLPIARLASTG